MAKDVDSDPEIGPSPRDLGSVCLIEKIPSSFIAETSYCPYRHPASTFLYGKHEKLVDAAI
jgi:hypothetical protein